MYAYRYYRMSGLGQMGYVEPLEAKDDTEAVRIAMAKKDIVESEVWDGDRLVAEIPAHTE